jgi:endoglycosylceramidase
MCCCLNQPTNQPTNQPNNVGCCTDNEHIIFFEPAVSDILRSGFTEGPGGPAYNDRQAYSYHIYCAPTDEVLLGFACTLMANGCLFVYCQCLYLGHVQDGDPTNLFVCNITDAFLYSEKVRDYHRIGVGGFMTEFGAMLGTENGVDSLHFVTGIRARALSLSLSLFVSNCLLGWLVGWLVGIGSI